MIRHVALINFKPETKPDQIEAFATALRNLRIPGLIKVSCGSDLRLKDGNMAFVAIADLEDVEAYRRYDTDEEHNRIRREFATPMTESLARAQYEL